ncbi:glycosyltransferase [Brachybacterium sp. GU-2]|uniref:glycosyltransferase n=1 Tax=Brachybacterium sp. GU-2 TaxID=3069708 RepID=UPI00298CF6F3|nr:glycosyltransferase [Brachybacterium sp. GU-2]WME21724.2 glycosyltransferase [Brachybacterium sp. GU-2]
MSVGDARGDGPVGRTADDRPARPAVRPEGAEPFAVLMPLWGKDRAERVEQAVVSATEGQQLRPDLLILTVDGPLTPELEELVKRVEAGAHGPATVLRHSAHRGVAAALQDGLESSPYELVARADADDLCRPERFALQIPRMQAEGLDLLGGAMREFSDRIAPGDGPLRTRPLTHAEITAYLPRHSPFHHPTMVLRRSTVLAVGGYRDLPLLEDYWLWERMMLGGARMANLPDVLVDYRVDEHLFARRGGWRLFASDLRLQRRFVKDRVTTPTGFLRNVGERGVYRLAPGWARRLAYRRFVEHDGRTA